MISATRKWIFLKVSGALLVPLMIWFILNLTMIYDEEYLKLIDFFTKPLSKFLFSIFIVTSAANAFAENITKNRVRKIFFIFTSFFIF